MPNHYPQHLHTFANLTKKNNLWPIYKFLYFMTSPNFISQNVYFFSRVILCAMNVVCLTIPNRHCDSTKWQCTPLQIMAKLTRVYTQDARGFSKVPFIYFVSTGPVGRWVQKNGNCCLKFSFSEVTKFAQSSSWFWHFLSKHQNHEEDNTNFWGLLRKARLYFCQTWW